MLPKSAMPRHHHGEERHAQSKLFANQVRQALAGDGAHARGHLLHHDQRDGGGDQCPEQGIAEFGARLRIGKDAAGIVINVGGDEAWPEDRKKGDQPIFDRTETRPAGCAFAFAEQFQLHHPTYL